MIRYEGSKPRKIERLISRIREGDNLQITGLWQSRLSFLLSQLQGELNNGLFVLARDKYRAGEIYEDLARLLPEDDIFLFPEQDVRPHEQIPVDSKKEGQRLKIYHRFRHSSRPSIAVSSIFALHKKLPPVWRWRALEKQLERGEEYDLKELTSSLIDMGYSRRDMVGGRGEFSSRGGIMDIFPPGEELPCRLEFFGDELESIRTFSLDDQRSRQELKKLAITPASELLLPGDFEQRINAVSRTLEKRQKELSGEHPKAAEKLQDKRARLLSEGAENFNSEILREYLPFFYDKLDSAFDFLPAETTYILEFPSRLENSYSQEYENLSDNFTDLLERGEVLPYYLDNFLTPAEMNQKLYTNHYIECLSEQESGQKLTGVDFRGQSIEPYHGRFDMLAERIEELLDENYTVLLGLSDMEKCRKLSDHLESWFSLDVVREVDLSSRGNEVIVLPCNLGEGFRLQGLKLAYFSEKEIMGEKKRQKKKIQDLEDTETISTFSELSPGDYVVHENHGIGKYMGLEPLSVQGQQKDYLLIQYADDDKLYVPTEQIHLVQKYIGGEGADPGLYRLGGNRWQQVKERVRSSVQELAVDLIELYAARETMEGYAFSEDTEWQQEFEDAFPFEETRDQKKAIADVKEDMESPHPMDRLLCGDVGYGKTEVAIRAAFKAAVDGRQTAVLVPTTILAQQHYNTFRERIDDFPINVAMLSRFRTPSQQKVIMDKVKKGGVDIVIGTHRLLSEDVEFKDLGLLVIDEEQRFGVSHKEKLKDMKKNIDVLTMTATPIPRTLHMALTGVRDMSVIETPPENRYPIRTYVKERDENLIRDAIRRELAREGQVYYVHNRVEDIKEQARMIRQEVPEASVAVAHGQMPENHLEKLMLDFYNREYDVLVCTTIIENGLDIANVNSIIINRADKMGLAQLYQLRGRVGRTDRIAYAYLLHNEEEVLSEAAEKRLRAIREFTELGSGFKIAMRDMEIRGAGNILGPEQSGHIASVGYSLYCKLLDRAVKELKGEEEKEEVDVEVNLDIDAYIPDEYIADSPQKVDIYKRLMKASSEEEIVEIAGEMDDRFGPLPEEVQNLLTISRIKMRASLLNVDLVQEREDRITCYFVDQENVDSQAVMKLARKYSRGIKIKSGRKPRLSVRKQGETEDDIQRLIQVFDDFLDFQDMTEIKAGESSGDHGGS